MRFRIATLLGILVVLGALARVAEETPLVAHSPTVSKTHVVFAYGGYLWSVPRDGGDARQLTTGGHEGLPVFSPDGKWIAFSGQYDGNVDVFVMPAEGGAPRRLTYHPASEIALGWTPDGKDVLFRSAARNALGRAELWRVPAAGGSATRYAFGECSMAAIHPDGRRIAFTRWSNE